MVTLMSGLSVDSKSDDKRGNLLPQDDLTSCDQKHGLATTKQIASPRIENSSSDDYEILGAAPERRFMASNVGMIPGLLGCANVIRATFSNILENIDQNQIKKMLMYVDAIAVAGMYYFLTQYGGNKVSDSKEGFPGVKNWDQVHKDALTNSFILLTVPANFWLAQGALKNILRIDMPELITDPDADLSTWQRRAVKTMSLVSSATLALLFVASCDETIKEYNLPSWFENVMYGMVACVMGTYTSFFYDDMKSIYKGVFKGDFIDYLKPSSFKYHLKNFLVRTRVEDSLELNLARARYAINPLVNESFILQQMVGIQNDSSSLKKLANHRSVVFSSLVLGVFGYFDLGLLLSSVSNIKDGGRDLVNMMLMLFGKGPVHLNNNWNVGLEFTILPLILPAWLVFVKTALRGAKTIKMYLSHQSNKFGLYGLGVLLSALCMTHVVACMGGASPEQLGATLGVMLLISAFAYSKRKDSKLLQRHAGSCLGMLSGMAFFAATYISVMKASSGSSCDHFDDQDDSCLAHVVDSAGTSVLGFLGPLGAGVIGLLMAGAFNVYAIDNAIDTNLNKIASDVSSNAVANILGTNQGNEDVVPQGLSVQYEQDLDDLEAVSTFNCIEDTGLARKYPEMHNICLSFKGRVNSYSQKDREGLALLQINDNDMAEI